jgi:hypothetical protein
MTPNKPLLLAAVILLLFVAPFRRFPDGRRNASASHHFSTANHGGCPEIFRPLCRNRPAQGVGTLNTDTPLRQEFDPDGGRPIPCRQGLYSTLRRPRH